MSDDPRNQVLEAARALERDGQIDPAVRAYLRAGSVAEAARVLAAVKRYADAGHLVMESLGVGPALVGGLDDNKKKLAAKAAVCFVQAGDGKRAVELFLALGDPARAAEAAERTGDPAEAARIRARFEKRPAAAASSVADPGAGAARAAAAKMEQAGRSETALGEYVRIRAFADAARVAYKLKRFPDAAQYFENASMPFEAAACFAEAGDKRRCLEAVVRVPRDHPKYRLSAAQAIRVASELGAFDVRLDPFVAPFVADGPKDDREVEALYLLGKLYRAGNLVEHAHEVFAKLARVRPGYRDVADQLARTTAAAKGPPSGDARARPDAQRRVSVTAKKKEESFPDLPELPLPPVAPAAPPQTSYGLRTVSGRFPAVVDPSRGPASTASMPRVVPPVSVPSPIASMTTPGALPAGSIVAERYRIEGKIGQGGMAVVYRASDLELGEQIAIKLFIQPSDDPMLLARFKQELTLSRGLAHPNIVRLYDIGQHQGCRFLTMELMHGTDLAAIIDGRPLEIGRGLRYLIQATAGLSLAHEKGVIHRDLKPANFFVTDDDVVKVMDFGIAKRQSAGAGLTQAGFIAGTPTYMSPEQINNFASVTHLTDLYALGIVAYEVFTGTVPFDHAEMMQLLIMQATRTPQPPSEHNPAIPPALDRLILKLLEKAPEDRIQTCRELGELLGAIKDQV